MSQDIIDILNLCKTLQDLGHRVSFLNSFGNIEIEHRDNESFEMIGKFTIRDIKNQIMIAAVNGYLSRLIAEQNSK